MKCVIKSTSEEHLLINSILINRIPKNALKEKLSPLYDFFFKSHDEIQCFYRNVFSFYFVVMCTVKDNTKLSN